MEIFYLLSFICFENNIYNKITFDYFKGLTFSWKCYLNYDNYILIILYTFYFLVFFS